MVQINNAKLNISHKTFYSLTKKMKKMKGKIKNILSLKKNNKRKKKSILSSVYIYFLIAKMEEMNWNTALFVILFSI